MRNYVLAPALLALALVATSPSALAEDDAVYQKLIKEKSPAVVSVKIVLKVTMTSQQGSRDQEINANSRGIVVDSSGLVMLPAGAFDASLGMGIPRRFRRQIDIKSTPLSIRVVFQGDTRDYDAVLGAKDSKLGLGFILIKDLGKKEIQAMDVANTTEPKIGQSLYAVTRLGQGFDYAPMVVRTRISGKVTKPRSMWIVQGAGGQVGQPLYDAGGAVAGIVVNQEGVGENASSRPFLLPAKVAMPTIKMSLKKSKDELDRILEEEEEAKAEAEDEEKKDEEKKDDGSKKADEPKKDEGSGKKDGDGE